MLNWIKLVAISFTLIHANFAFADTRALERTPQSLSPADEDSIGKSRSVLDRLKDTLGITYFTYFFGPGLHSENHLISPNQLGLPENDGIYFQNQISLRYKFSKTLAVDFQTRFKLILNNEVGNQNFSPFRWEVPRIGISGILASGADWSIVGAVNTDFPYFFPDPFSGFQAKQRTVLFNPGMFASLKYEPKNSRWSVFSVLSPRFFLYEDRNAAEPQFSSGGYIPQNKPEVILAFQPTLNYQLSPKLKLTLGSTIDYRKHICSDWNIFNASLITNGEGKAWRLSAVPIYLGVTYTFASYLTVFPYIGTYPIAAQRIDGRTGEQATLLEATSIGMWINGTIF